MRLWTLHPKYLDRQGLLGLWREGLLAQAVLDGQTKGYKNHPQVERFKNHPTPRQAIAYYLSVVYQEAIRRGYKFDQSKISFFDHPQLIPTTTGQLAFEHTHLLKKLQIRSETDYLRLSTKKILDPHPLFHIVHGEIEDWEKGKIG
jgi:hypothetical protein